MLIQSYNMITFITWFSIFLLKISNATGIEVCFKYFHSFLKETIQIEKQI